MTYAGFEDEELLIAVANTAHGERDEFADGRAVRAWWRELGTTPARPGGVMAPESVALLRELQRLLRGLALRNNGIEPDLSGLSVLPTLPLRLDLQGVPTLHAEPPGDLARDIGAATVAALLRAMARPSWP